MRCVGARAKLTTTASCGGKGKLRVTRRLAGLTMLVAFGVVGCDVPVGVTPPPTPSPYSTPGSIVWTDCGGGFRCGTVAVPLDYSNPTRGTIKIGVIRRPAPHPSLRIGSLVINPGGPGISGISFLRASGAQMTGLNARFDLVSFDPRGVGQSAPVVCVTDAQRDALNAVDPVLDDPTEKQTYVQAEQAFAAGCEKKSGRILPYVDIASAAKDMDVLRAALGDPKLSYLGFSYGTYLGEMYAQLFPTRIRALALDAVVDPSVGPLEWLPRQAAALDANLQGFMTYCTTHSLCQFGAAGDPEARLLLLLRRLDSHPIAVAHRMLTRSLALAGILDSLYSPFSWEVLSDALTAADGGEGQLLLTLADRFNRRHADGSYTNEPDAAVAIGCSGFLHGTSDITAYDQLGPELTGASAVFGPALQYSLSICSRWPVKARQEPGPLSVDGAPPILLVGATEDPYTPYAFAQSVNKQLAGSVLLTRRGYGHPSYPQSQCVRDAVNTYLVYGTTPAPATVCASDLAS